MPPKAPKAPKAPTAETKWQALVARVGTTPERKLAWAVGFAQSTPFLWTDGDVANLTEEVRYAFDLDPFEPDPDKGRLYRLHAMTERAVRRAVAHEGFAPDAHVSWDDSQRRFLLVARDFGNFSHRVDAALCSWILAAGHLVRSCAAPALRSKELCDRWFVQTRPQQAYCSATCQSRAAVRLYRDRKAAAPSRRRKRR